MASNMSGSGAGVFNDMGLSHSPYVSMYWETTARAWNLLGGSDKDGTMVRYFPPLNILEAN